MLLALEKLVFYSISWFHFCGGQCVYGSEVATLTDVLIC